MKDVILLESSTTITTHVNHVKTYFGLKYKILQL